MNDEQLAKQLHDLEISEHKSRLEEQQRQDEEFARKLAQEYSIEARQSQSALTPSYRSLGIPIGASVLRLGDQAAVRLHNHASNLSIGELFRVITHDTVRIRLQLFDRQAFLRVSNTGNVEYSTIMDSQSLFLVEPVPGTTFMYLLPEGHLSKYNSNGQLSWVLSLLSNGRFIGNGHRDVLSQWALIADTPPTGEGNITLACSAAAPVMARTQSHVDQQLFNTSIIGNLDMNIFDLLALGIELSPDQQMQWLETTTGRAYLNENASPQLQQIYRSGNLKSYMYRPDWFKSLSRWKDHTQLTDYNINDDLLRRDFPLSLQKEFFEQGYTLIRQAASQESVANALKLALYSTQSISQSSAVSKSVYGRIEVKGAISSDADFLELFYGTSLIHIAQKLIGVGEILRPRSCRVSVAVPSLLTKPAGMSLQGKNWVIDGFTGATKIHSPYTMLIGIALTDMSVPYSGNHCVYAFSHVLLQEHYKQQAHMNCADMSSPLPSSSKPPLEEPEQLLLKPGDAFVCTQRLAYISAPNFFSQRQAMVYFEISHVDHDSLRGPALDGIWIEFKGINDIELPPPSAIAGPVPIPAASITRDLHITEEDDFSSNPIHASAEFANKNYIPLNQFDSTA